MAKLTRRQAAKQDVERKRVRRRRIILGALFGAMGIAIISLGFVAFRPGGATTKAHLRQDPVVSDAADTTVKVLDNDYEPRDLTVHKGSTVTFDFQGNATHNVTDDNGAFESPSQSDGTWKLTTTDTGTYSYYCTLHHAMMGTLKVVE